MTDFKRGLRSGVPIGLGYLSVSFTFGMMAVANGMSWWQALLISMTCVTSAGQFAGMGLMPYPGQAIPILVSQLTINIRYSFMSVSLSQKLEERFSGLFRWLQGFFMTDEIFAVASAEKEVTRRFFAGLSVIPYLGWSLGTLFGALLGSILPHRLMSAFGLAIYGMFVAIVVPDAKEQRPVLAVAILACAVSCLFYYVPFLSRLNGGLTISVCAILAAVIGAVLFPVKDEGEEGSL